MCVYFGCVILVVQKSLKMASLGDNKMQMEKLTSENYHDWAFDMKMLLMRADVWNIVTGEETLAEDASLNEKAMFQKRENRALSSICLAVSKECKIYVRSAKTSKEAWDSLENHYEEKTLARRVMYRQKL